MSLVKTIVDFHITPTTNSAEIVINVPDAITIPELEERLFDPTTLQIWTGTGGSGTQLVQDTDYTIDNLSKYAKQETGVSIYSVINITNVIYHNVDLYIPIGSLNQYGDVIRANDINFLWATRPLDWSDLIADTEIITNTTILNDGQRVYVDGIVNTSQKNSNYKIGDGTTQWQNPPYKLPVYIEISADTDLSSYDFAVNGNEIIIYNSDSSSHTVIFDDTTTETVLANNFIRERYADAWLNVYSGYTYNGVSEIPIGGQYIQVASVASNTITVACPTSESPASLYGGTWTELWDTESIFLRTEGTLADADRTTGKQEDAMQECTGIIGSFSNDEYLYSPVDVSNPPSLSGVFDYTDTNYTSTNRVPSTTTSGTKSNTRGLTFALSGSTSPNPAKTNDDETRVVNRLMIIWKRTA